MRFGGLVSCEGREAAKDVSFHHRHSSRPPTCFACEPGGSFHHHVRL